jgi:hypothetical protein
MPVPANTRTPEQIAVGLLHHGIQIDIVRVQQLAGCRAAPPFPDRRCPPVYSPAFTRCTTASRPACTLSLTLEATSAIELRAMMPVVPTLMMPVVPRLVPTLGDAGDPLRLHRDRPRLHRVHCAEATRPPTNT